MGGDQIVDYYRQAVDMVTAPGAFLEVTNIKRDGYELKAYKNAPGVCETSGCWAKVMAIRNTSFMARSDGPMLKPGES